MANELERMLAGLLKPKTPEINNDFVDRYEGMADEITVAESVTATTGDPEGRVGFATVAYSEVLYCPSNALAYCDPNNAIYLLVI